METIEAITNKTSIGDWWILYVLSTNIDPLIYRDIMTKLSKEIETADSNNAPYASGGGGGYHSSSVWMLEDMDWGLSPQINRDMPLR